MDAWDKRPPSADGRFVLRRRADRFRPPRLPRRRSTAVSLGRNAPPRKGCQRWQELSTYVSTRAGDTLVTMNLRQADGTFETTRARSSLEPKRNMPRNIERGGDRHERSGCRSLAARRRSRGTEEVAAQLAGGTEQVDVGVEKVELHKAEGRSAERAGGETQKIRDGIAMLAQHVRTAQGVAVGGGGVAVSRNVEAGMVHGQRRFEHHLENPCSADAGRNPCLPRTGKASGAPMPMFSLNAPMASVTVRRMNAFGEIPMATRVLTGRQTRRVRPTWVRHGC